MNNPHGHGGDHHHGHGDSPYCYFHPKELLVGVCALCLKERLLLILASKQGADLHSPTDDGYHSARHPASAYRALRRKTSSISLPKVFALGSFLQRLDSRHHRPDDNKSDADNASIASLDDSFISIKFEDNGKATWDNRKANAAAFAGDGAPKKVDPAIDKVAVRSSTVVEHVKRGGVTRWRKQVVGRLLQLARWKRSGKASGAACHVGIDGKKAAERSKGRSRGWIRSLTRRRAGSGAAHGERAWS